MIPALIVGVLIGAIIGLAIAAWRHAATIAPPVEQHVQWTALGLGNGKGGHDPEAHQAATTKPFFES